MSPGTTCTTGRVQQGPEETPSNRPDPESGQASGPAVRDPGLCPDLDLHETSASTPQRWTLPLGPGASGNTTKGTFSPLNHDHNKAKHCVRFCFSFSPVEDTSAAGWTKVNRGPAAPSHKTHFSTTLPCLLN